MTKMKNIIYVSLLIVAALTLGSCNKFLDEMPDNRATLDSPEKIQKLLVSAYANRSYARMCEIASDNCDDLGPNNPHGNLLLYANSYWMDMNEADNDSNKNTWQQYYYTINVANTALQGIIDLGDGPELQAYKGEALLCRAYAHFCLTMLYCLPYHPEKSSQYHGIPYMEAPETKLNPHYERGNLKEVYEKIARDIEEGLPLVSDVVYSVPKYHFNEAAAYAFATRFYLNYMKWEKVVEYADKVLGADPSSALRDWEATAQLPYDYLPRTLDYIDPKHKFNLLLIPLYSACGDLFNAGWDGGARYAHNNRVSKTETFRAKRPMGGMFDSYKYNSSSQIYHCWPMDRESNTVNKVYMNKWTSQWEVANPVTGSGYSRCTFVTLTTNEVLLNRAEAYIHLKEYDKAAADLEIWNQSFCKVGQNGVVSLTRERINEVYGNSSSSAYIAEYTAEKPTSRKPINPHGFEIEAGEQEYMIQAALYCRRLDFLGEGLRWTDLKRYGIVVHRFDDTNYIDNGTTGFRVSATLDEKDLRRAFQLPQDVIAAGLEANPRNETSPNHPFCQ